MKASPTKIIQTIDNIKREIPFINIKPYSHNLVMINLQILQKDLDGDEDEFQRIIHLHFYKLYKLGWKHIFKVKNDKGEWVVPMK